ncbi:hypothetical protein Tco_0643895 [Tanacetum coccineum]
MLTGKWTPMNREVTRFNSMVDKTKAMSGENDEDWMARVEILYKTHTRVDFKHKSACLFFKGKHKWKNPDSTMARRSRGRITNEEAKHFREDVLSRPPGSQRIAKSQHSSNSTTSFGSNLTMFQEIMQQQYEFNVASSLKFFNFNTSSLQKDVRYQSSGSLETCTFTSIFKYHALNQVSYKAMGDKYGLDILRVWLEKTFEFVETSTCDQIHRTQHVLIIGTSQSRQHDKF